MAGHAQQNGEQLNNLLKTLHGCYLRAQEVGQGGPAQAAGQVRSGPPCFEVRGGENPSGGGPYVLARPTWQVVGLWYRLPCIVYI